MIAPMHNKTTQTLLNVGHAMDHMMLLVFATAVTSIAAEFGLARWEDLMPYGVAAFFFFGIGSLPAGKLGDHWGRRKMMLVFFFGIGASLILAGLVPAAGRVALDGLVWQDDAARCFVPLGARLDFLCLPVVSWWPPRWP